MEIADVVYDINARKLKLKHSNVFIEDFGRDASIEIIMYMITVVEDDTIALDNTTGEINPTKLAELARDTLNIVCDENDIPQDLFEIAFAVSKEYDTPYGVENTD